MKQANPNNQGIDQPTADFGRYLRQSLGEPSIAPVNELAWIQKRIDQHRAKPSIWRSLQVGVLAIAAAVLMVVMMSPAQIDANLVDFVAPDMPVEETLAVDDAWYEYIGVL